MHCDVKITGPDNVLTELATLKYKAIYSRTQNYLRSNTELFTIEHRTIYGRRALMINNNERRCMHYKFSDSFFIPLSSKDVITYEVVCYLGLNKWRVSNIMNVHGSSRGRCEKEGLVLLYLLNIILAIILWKMMMKIAWYHCHNCLCCGHSTCSKKKQGKIMHETFC